MEAIEGIPLIMKLAKDPRSPETSNIFCGIVDDMIDASEELPIIELRDRNDTTYKDLCDHVKNMNIIYSSTDTLNKIANDLYNLNQIGIGSGEIYIARGCDDIVINGQNATSDLLVGNKKVEVKSVIVGKKDQLAKNFRLGALYIFAMTRFIRDMRRLFEAAYADTMTLNDDQLRRIRSGEMCNAVIYELSRIDVEKLRTSRAGELTHIRGTDPDSGYYMDNEFIGSDFESVNKWMMDNPHPKPYTEILQEFTVALEEIGQQNIPIIWVVKPDKNSISAPKMYVTESITGLGFEIDEISQNKVKIKTKIF
jgi:hypothetical protein